MKTSNPFRDRGLRPVSDLASNRPHGTRLRYMAGCKCQDCRQANSRYESERQQARRRGEWNDIVSAEPARLHIFKLAKAGLGRRSIAAVTDLRASTIGEIRQGRKMRIRAMTANKILAVTPDLASDRCLVPAGRLWQRIRLLLEEGYTRQSLANKLGYRHRGLQFGKVRVTAKSAHRVERLYHQLTA